MNSRRGVGVKFGAPKYLETQPIFGKNKAKELKPKLKIGKYVKTFLYAFR